MAKIFYQLKLIFLISYRFLIRNWKVAGLILVIALLSGLTYLKFRPNKDTQLSEGIIGTFQENDLPEQATRLLSQSLVESQNGRAIPKLVEGWDVNNNATVFTFKLKKNLYWSDGTKVHSQDIAFNIPDVDVSYPDENSIQFKLKDSFSPFPALLTKPVFKNGSLIGIGPYQLTRVEKSRIFITKLTLTTSDPNLVKDLIIRFYPNEKTALTAFQIGEVKALLGVSKNLDTSPLVSLEQKTTYQRLVTILYNIKDPVLSNRSLRQALGYSAPSMPGEVEAKTSIAPNSWAYFPEVNDYLDNIDGAKSALERAKNALDKDALTKEIILTSTPQLEEVGQQIVSRWRELGLKVDLRVESGVPQNFQALLIAQTIPSDPDQYSLWHSTQTQTNLTKYSSARVDKDLEDGRKAIKEEDRKVKYDDFQKQILEDSPATFLYFPKYNVLYLKKTKQKLDKVLPLQLVD